MTMKDASQQKALRNAMVIGAVTALLLAIPASPLVLIAIIYAGVGGNSTFGGLGAAAQTNTEWWGPPLAVGALVLGVLIVFGGGFLVGRRSYLRQMDRR
jgi:hypothetical protein